ncbi:hypothetical protein PV327_003096 [Microctonus hyperodae]|uniref:TGF-beta family profile domain-containing protein n=1 Tax=Microctonus hyperodae TaxID=165561 RepID=A0AA39L0N6_MICHY|nr:hypothetical protein PV327_003096 [Microctonus hyperodae]
MGEHPTVTSASNRDIKVDIDLTRESNPSTIRQHQPLPSSRPLAQSPPHSILVVLVLPLIGFRHHTLTRPSTVVVGCILISLLVFGLFRPALTVPMRMRQRHHQQLFQTVENSDDDDDEEERDRATMHDYDEFETVRRSIVEGLGLERIPDPSKANISQAEYERAHEEYLTRLEMSRAPGDTRQKRLHTFYATDEIIIEQSYITHEKVHQNNLENHQLYFPVKLPDDNSIVDHATLRLLLHSDNWNDRIDVIIYRMVNTSRHFVSQKIIDGLDGPRWIELDTTEPANLWHEGITDNYGLELYLKSATGANVGFSNPVFNVFTTSNIRTLSAASRTRRAAPEQLLSLHKGRRTECRGESKKCCRHEMSVVFKDLKGFEFIVQPKNFDAGYCKGRCPPRYNPAHHHALLQSLIWKQDRRKAPRPCCAPSKLAELEILYFDENDPTKLKVSSWKNMKVLECACS